MDKFAIAVKAFIVNDKEELLTIKRRSNDVHKPGVWDIPGGRLDSLNESPFDGLKREVMEEAGLDIEIVNPLTISHFTRDDGQKITMLIFICKPLTEEVVLSEEHTDFAWTPIDEAEERLAHHFHDNIAAYNKFFKHKV